MDATDDVARRLWAEADALLAAGRPDMALLRLEEAARRHPGDPRHGLRVGQCLARLGRHAEALAAAARCEPHAQGSAPLADGLGTLYTHCEQPERALPWFERAVAIAPGTATYWYNLAAAQRMLGRLDAADASLGTALELNPDDCGAHYMRADLRTQSPERNHVAQLRAALARTGIRPGGEILLRFALAKELEDLGDHAGSFAELQRGCGLQRAAMRYDVGSDIEAIERIIACHGAEALATGRGHESAAPIFVFGLPRSGTTLVESVIAAHPRVHAAGELPAFPQACIEGVHAGGAPADKLAFVERALQVDPARLGARYLELAGTLAGDRPRFIDKLPLNYLYAGLIHRALPNARLVAVVRNPMDSCFAMYKTLFTGAYPFSYDLDDLGRYYLAWERLIGHWQHALGEAFLVVRYEDLVSDQEATTRRLLAHCGLAWDPRCLDFHAHRAAVTSASAVQVRRPLYSSSVGKWRRYERELAPLARHFAGRAGN